MQAKLGNFESLGLPVFWHGDVMAHSTFSLLTKELLLELSAFFIGLGGKLYLFSFL